jgi:hypothetical protein
LAGKAVFHTVLAVIGFLRFLGMTNAAVWLGSAVFLMICVEPAVFSQETHKYFDKSFGYLSDVVVQLIRSRYLYLGLGCGGVAILHQLAEWLYLGRPVRRLSLWLLGVLVTLTLLNGCWVQPRLAALHETRFRGATPALRQAAQKSFSRWQTASDAADVLLIGSLVVYLWHVANQADPLRFVGTKKIYG